MSVATATRTVVASELEAGQVVVFKDGSEHRLVCVVRDPRLEEVLLRFEARSWVVSAGKPCQVA